MNIRDFVEQILPWILSAITIYMTLMAGNKHPKAWIIGVANQGLWMLWISTTASWGFVPMNVALTWVYVRNHLKWNYSQHFNNRQCNE